MNIGTYTDDELLLAWSAYGNRPESHADSLRAFLAALPDRSGTRAEIVAYRDAHDAAKELGYPSLTEALEELEHLQNPTPHPTVEGVARAIRRRRFERTRRLNSLDESTPLLDTELDDAQCVVALFNKDAPDV